MTRTPSLTLRTVLAASAFLAATVAGAGATTPPVGLPLVAAQADGKMLFLKHCRTCHGATGVPSKQSIAKYKNIHSLADAEFMAKRSDDSIVVVIRKGVNNEKEMKGFDGKLTTDEMRSIAQYARTLSTRK